MIISDKQKEYIKNAHHRYNIKIRSEEVWENLPRYSLYDTKKDNRKKR